MIRCRRSCRAARRACRTSSMACGARAGTTGSARLVVKVGGGRIGLARMQELREAVGDVPRVGQAHRGLVRDLRRVHPRQRAVLPGHRVRPDLPAAVRVGRAYRRGGRAAVPARCPGQGRRRLPECQAVRVQVGRRQPDRTRLHRAGPGGRRTAGRIHRRADHRRDRRAPRQDRASRPARCSTAGRSWPRTRSPRAWSTRSATGTRSTRRSARRPGRTRSCSTSPATSGRTRWPSEPRSCPTRASASSR